MIKVCSAYLASQSKSHFTFTHTFNTDVNTIGEWPVEPWVSYSYTTRPVFAFEVNGVFPGLYFR